MRTYEALLRPARTSYSSSQPSRLPIPMSRSTTTRRHRSNRSHHGGSSYAPQNEFPVFAHTGDVEIIINHEGQEKRYTLHRLILAQWSGFFEASTSEEWSRAQAQGVAQSPAQYSNYGSMDQLGKIGEESDGSAQSKNERVVPVLSPTAKPRWRYELDTDSQEDEVPMLIQKVRSHILKAVIIHLP